MNTMEGTIDIRLVVTLAGILVSVATAAAIARQQIKVIEDAVKDMEQRLRGMDRRMDQAESGVSVHEQRVQVLSNMLSPETQERRHKEIANLQAPGSAYWDKRHPNHSAAVQEVLALREKKNIV